MNSLNTKTNILIVAATGKLGSLVTKHCLNKPDLQVNVLVRNPQKNKSLMAQVEAAGGKVFKGDATRPETIKGTTKGMHTVVMTFDNYDGQIAVINDCVENKVERVVHSSFLTNLTKFSREEISKSYLLLNKVRIPEYLKTVPIKSINIDTGVFLDWFFGDVVSGGFEYWGEAHTKLQLTSYDDTAKFVAAVVARKDFSGDAVFAANELSVSETAEIYNRVRGTNLKAKKLGTLEELRVSIEKSEKKGDPYASIYRFYEFMFDERGRFDKVHNSEFPEVKATSVEEFLKLRPYKVGF